MQEKLFFAADIYDEVSAPIQALGLDTECLGGGRIEHFPDKKFLKVFGYSTVSKNLYKVSLPNALTASFLFLISGLWKGRSRRVKTRFINSIR